MTDDCPFDGEVPATRPPVPTPKPQSELERVINTPNGELKFGDYVKLKSGRDQFSRMKTEELHAHPAICNMEWNFIVAAFRDDFHAHESCARWMLRGLDIDKAIRKVNVDKEITDKAIAARRR